MKLLTFLFVTIFFQQAWATLGCEQVSGSYIREHGDRTYREMADNNTTYWARRTLDSNRAIIPYADRADCENNPLSPTSRIDAQQPNSDQLDACGEGDALRLTAMPGLTNDPNCDRAMIVDKSSAALPGGCNHWGGGNFPEDFYESGLFKQCSPRTIFQAGGLAEQLTGCDKDLFTDWTNSGGMSNDLFCNCSTEELAFQHYLNNDFSFAQRKVWCSTGSVRSGTCNKRLGKTNVDTLGVLDYSAIPHLEMSHQYVFDRKGDDDFNVDGSAQPANKAPRDNLKSSNQYMNVFIPLQSKDGRCGIEVAPGEISTDFSWGAGSGPRTHGNNSVSPSRCTSVAEDNMNLTDPVGMCMVFSAIKPSNNDSSYTGSIRNSASAQRNGQFDDVAGRYGAKSRCRMSDYGFFHRKIGTRNECLGIAGEGASGGGDDKFISRPHSEPPPGDGGLPGVSRCSCNKNDSDLSNDKHGEILCYGWEDKTGEEFYYFIDCDKARFDGGKERLPFDVEYNRINCDITVNINGVQRSCCDGYLNSDKTLNLELSRACAAQVSSSKR